MQNKTLEQNYKNNYFKNIDAYKSILYLIIIFFVNYSVNGNIEFKGFFMDDLAIWSVYHNSSIIEFIFNTYANKFRPISNLFMVIGFEIVGYNTHVLHWYLLIANFFIAITIFKIATKITENIHISLCVSVAYIFSRLAYYQVGQYFGIMEATGMFFALLTLYFAYKFVNSDGTTNDYYKCVIMFTLCCFSHERYMALISILLLVPLLKDRLGKRKIIHYELISIVCISLILIVRFVLLKDTAFAGTGGSSVVNELNLFQVLKFIIYGIANILGVNAGEAYLTGISVKEVSIYEYILVFIYIFCILFTAILAIKLLTDKVIKKDNIFIRNNILFITFIFFTIASSSITIRLEMRWIYTPFAGFLLLYGYWVSYLYKSYYFRDKAITLLIVMVMIQMPMELYYRSYYKFIYFTGAQGVYNTLYTETIKKYGDSLYMRPIVFIENEEIFIHEQEIKSFYREYKKADSLPDSEIYIYRHLNEIPEEVFAKSPTVIVVDSSNPNDGFKKQVMDITNEFNYYINNKN